MNYMQCLKREGMHAWAVPATLKSRDYAPLKSGEWWLYSFPTWEGSAAPCWLCWRCWVLRPALPSRVCAGPGTAAAAWNHLQELPCRGVLTAYTRGGIRTGVVAFVMILFVSAGLSHSALTSPQNIQLPGFVTLLQQRPSIIHWGHCLQM